MSAWRVVTWPSHGLGSQHFLLKKTPIPLILPIHLLNEKCAPLLFIAPSVSILDEAVRWKEKGEAQRHAALSAAVNLFRAAYCEPRH